MLMRMSVAIFILLMAGHATAQPAVTKPPDAVVAQDDTAQLKATIVKLQKAVLALRKENGILQATVAELQEAALEAAIETFPPEVKKALGRPEPKPVIPPKD
jgi:hypothetical protein